MDFLISANPRVVFAFWLGVVVIAMALLMLLVILVMRQVVTRRERNRIRAATQWHQILLDSAQGMATSPPSLPRAARAQIGPLCAYPSSQLFRRHSCFGAGASAPSAFPNALIFCWARMVMLSPGLPPAIACW